MRLFYLGRLFRLILSALSRISLFDAAAGAIHVRLCARAFAISFFAVVVVQSALPLIRSNSCLAQQTDARAEPSPKPAARKFDEYELHGLFSGERNSLDAFAQVLQQEPNSIGYYIYFPGRKEPIGTAEARANQARCYLLSVRAIDERQLRFVMKGYRESLTVQLWLAPRGVTPPVPNESKNPPSLDRPILDVKDLRSGYIQALAFSPNGKILAVAHGAGGCGGSIDNTVRLWSVSTGQEYQTLEGHQAAVNGLAFSPDGKLLVSASTDGIIRVWDLATGTLSKSFHAGGKSLSLSMNTVSGTLAVADETRTIKLWDIHSGKEVDHLVGDSTETIGRVAFRSDGQALASTGHLGGENSGEGRLVLWDLKTHRPIRVFKSDSSLDLPTFSPDGKSIACTWGGGTGIRIWDLTSNREAKPIDGDGDFVFVSSISFSPDNKYLVGSAGGEGSERYVFIWDKTGQKKATRVEGDGWAITSLVFSSDGRMVATGGGDKVTKLWEFVTQPGKVKLNQLAGLVAVNDKDWLVFTPDGLFDGSVAAWQQLVWRFSLGPADTLPVEAFFNEFFHPELLSALFAGQRPIAAQNITAKDRRQPQIRVGANSQKSDAPVTTRDLTLNLWVKEAPQVGKVPAGGVRDVRLFRNGALVRAWHEAIAVDKKGEATLQATIPIVAGENQFSAYAFNRDNIKSTNASFTVRGDASLKRTGTLYILSVGINHYDNSQFDLKFANPDATAMADEMGRKQEELGQYGRVAVIKLLDSNATKARVLGVLQRMAGLEVLPDRLAMVSSPPPKTTSYKRTFVSLIVITSALGIISLASALFGRRKLSRPALYGLAAVGVFCLLSVAGIFLKRASFGYQHLQGPANFEEPLEEPLVEVPKLEPEDGLVLFFAGHGLALSNHFYMIPHDMGYAGARDQIGSDLASITAHAISDQDLSGILEQIGAGQMLLVIDACQSGQALEGEEKRLGPMNSRGLAQLAYEKGMYVLTAAQSYQAALEAEQLGHGYLTYVLIDEGLDTNKADESPRDGAVTEREWFDHAISRVPEMQIESMEKSRLLLQDLAFVPGEETIKNPDNRNVQRPRMFYPREAPAQPFIVARF
jgi:WD40 repeat protein